MDLGSPHRAVVAGLDGDILVLLAGISRPLTGRQVSARLGASPEGVRRSLARLVEQGIVLRDPAGGAFLHRLNREHVATPAVIALAEIRTSLWAALRHALAHWDPPAAHASVFGSAARGDGDAHSDIDLFLLRRTNVDAEDEVWRAQIEALSVKVWAWTGNELSVIEYDEEDLGRLLPKSPPVLQELRRDGIDLAGTPLRKILQTSDAAA